jgi:pre-mRNA-processing factor 19
MKEPAYLVNSLFRCLVTGVVPKEPVVSKTGYVFERSVATRYIEANGKCPISGEAMSVDDLLTVKGESTFTRMNR